VADAVRADTDPDLAAAVDDAVADGWLGALADARRRETEEQTGAWLVRAARSAAPYLLRRGRWNDLDHVADHLLARDLSVGTAAGLAPMLAAAVEATRGSRDQELEFNLGRTHARTVLRLDAVRGVALLEGLLAAAVTAGRYDQASNLAGDLVDCYRNEGRYGAALDLTDQMAGYSRRAGFGPWTQLADQAQRLQVLLVQGRHREVLDGVEQLRVRMAGLPARPDPATERVDAWMVRETVLNTGALAARELGLWEQALELNAENLASMRARGASAYQQAFDRFNDFGPLRRSGRAVEARELLIGCRAVFEQVDDLASLGKTLSALAAVEDQLGHLQRAVDLAREALRFTYAAADPEAVGGSHHNLATYLQDSGADPGLVGAHRVAASVIAAAIGGQGHLPGRLAALGRLLADAPDRVPRSFAQVCALVGQVPGVDLAGLLARLPGPGDPDAAVQAVLTAAPGAADDAAAAAQVGWVEQALAEWEPVVSALHVTLTDADAHRRGEAAARLATVLDANADTDDWRALVAVLRRILAGERDPDTLLAGLDDIDTAITRHALDLLAGTVTVDPDAWHTLGEDTTEEDPATAFAALVAAAATGDTTARPAVEPLLAELQTDPETAGLAAALRRILDGADDPSQDVGLPPDQTAVLAAVRQHLTTPEHDEPET
jgi:tetratricopeptide (TPR) repeat protein